MRGWKALLRRRGRDLADAGARARSAQCFSEAVELLPDLVQPALALCALRSLAVPDALEVLDLQWQCKGGISAAKEEASGFVKHRAAPDKPCLSCSGASLNTSALNILPQAFQNDILLIIEAVLEGF